MSTVGELREALAQANGAQKVELLKRLSAALEQEGTLGEAARCLVEAHRLAPSDLEIARAGFRVFSTGKQWPGALKWLTVELTLTLGDAARAQVLLRTGKLYQDELHDLERAQQAYAEARQLDPDVFSERVAPAPAPADLAGDGLEGLDELGLGPPPAASNVDAAAAPSRPPTAPHPDPASAAHPSRPPPRPRPAPGTKVTLVKLRPWLFAAAPVTLVVLALLVRGVATGLPDNEQCPGSSTLKKTEQAPDLVTLSCVSGQTRDGVTVTMQGDVVRSRVVYAAGRRQGPAFETEDGLRAEGGYLDDRRDGRWAYSRNGLPVRAETFVRGVLQGVVSDYLPDGGSVRVQEYDGGVAWGHYQTWRDDGTRNLEGQFLAGERSGVWSRYSAIGAMEESWDEPRVDAGERHVEVFIDDKAEPLYAARSASWWRTRVIELRRNDTEQGRQVLQLTLARAKLLGVPLEAK
jgi:hypothetical protein